MPTYVYECQEHGEFDVVHNMTDNSLRNCPECNKEAKKLIVPGAGIKFNGTGFYCTDHTNTSYFTIQDPKKKRKKKNALSRRPAQLF